MKGSISIFSVEKDHLPNPESDLAGIKYWWNSKMDKKERMGGKKKEKHAFQRIHIILLSVLSVTDKTDRQKLSLRKRVDLKSISSSQPFWSEEEPCEKNGESWADKRERPKSTIVAGWAPTGPGGGWIGCDGRGRENGSSDVVREIICPESCFLDRAVDDFHTDTFANPRGAVTHWQGDERTCFQLGHIRKEGFVATLTDVGNCYLNKAEINGQSVGTTTDPIKELGRTTTAVVILTT